MARTYSKVYEKVCVDCSSCFSTKIKKNTRCEACKQRRTRSMNLTRCYGITLEDYEHMLSEQGGCCAICKTTDPGARTKYWFVDHNHKTGKVRGLLCSTCNFGIGSLKDDPVVVKNALRYLFLREEW